MAATDNTELLQKLQELEDEEITRKVAQGYYSDDALQYAIAEIKRRGLAVPAVNFVETEKKIPFYKKHPIWFITFLGLGIKVASELIKQIMY